MTVPISALGEGHYTSLTFKNSELEVGRLYHCKPHNLGKAHGDTNDIIESPYILLAMAPTRGFKNVEKIAQSGEWTVSVKNAEVDCFVTLQVQRDDAATDVPNGARQAYLTTPAHASIVTNSGTNSAYSTTLSKYIFIISAGHKIHL